MKKIDPRCYTPESMRIQTKKMKKWKMMSIVASFIISALIIGTISYELTAFEQSIKWEWTTGGTISASQLDMGLNETGDFGLLDLINSTAVADLIEWVSQLNSTEGLNISYNEELQRLLTEALGNNATLDDFINAIHNGTLKGEIIRSIVSAWVDSITESLSDKWAKPLVLIGTYRGSVTIKKFMLNVYFEVNGTRGALINVTRDKIETNESLSLSLSLSNLIGSIINVSKPIIVNFITERVTENSFNKSADEFEREFFEEILPQISPKLGSVMKQNIGLFDLSFGAEIDIGKIISEVSS